MTTTATPGTEAEATPTPESPTPETVVNDEPLIPQESVDEGALVTEQGQDEQTVGADDAEVDGAATTETATDTVESKAEVAKTYSEDEVNKIRSGLDTRIANIEKSNTEVLQATQQRAAQAEQQLQAATLDIQAAQWQQQRAQSYISQGLSDEESQRLAAVETKNVRSAYEFELRALNAESALKNAQSSEEQTNTRVAAQRLASLHGIPEADIPQLMNSTTPDAMVSLAKRLGELTKNSKELADNKLAAVSSGDDANKIDSGGGTGGSMTDDQFVNAYASGQSDDHARYAKVRQTRGY